jgi:hypothetical protein
MGGRKSKKKSDAELAALASTINEEHQQVVEASQSSLEHAIEAGIGLLDAKANVKHGTWEAWLKANCPNISLETVRLYMRLAKGEEKLKKAAAENGNAVAEMSIRGAAKLLANKRSTTSTKNYVKALNTAWSSATDDQKSAFVKENLDVMREILETIEEIPAGVSTDRGEVVHTH